MIQHAPMLAIDWIFASISVALAALTFLIAISTGRSMVRAPAESLGSILRGAVRSRWPLELPLFLARVLVLLAVSSIGASVCLHDAALVGENPTMREVLASPGAIEAFVAAAVAMGCFFIAIGLAFDRGKQLGAHWGRESDGFRPA